MHIALFEPPRDVMQVRTLSAQLGHGSELIDWHGDATLYPTAICFLTCRHEQTNKHRVHSLKVIQPDPLKKSKLLNDECTKYLYSPAVPINFPEMQKSFFSALPKRVYQAPLRLHSKPSQRKPAKRKKTSSDEISQRSSITL